MVEDKEGTEFVRLARASIAWALEHPESPDVARHFRSERFPPSWEVRRGVFVTLKRHPDGALRGCIGIPLPVYPLRTAIPRAARAAALEDPRFPPLRLSELSEVLIEVSVLTVPKRVTAASPEALLRKVMVGRDGLIVDAAESSGLLLPQVAVEQNWTSEEFLNQTCIKAGLPHEAWRHPGTSVRTFQAQVFGEIAPKGSEIVERGPVGIMPAHRDGSRVPQE